jgi:rsbT co-antagonist protein RsbR
MQDTPTSPDPRLSLFLKILDAAPLVLWALDKNGQFTMAEGRGLEGLGSKPGEWVGRDALADWKGTPAEAAMRRALAGEEFRANITVAGPHHYDVWYVPIRDAEGAPDGMFGLALDVTKEREASAALAEKLALVEHQQSKIEHFTRAINAAPVTIWMMDNLGKILLSEGGVLPKLGLKPGESVGMSAFDMFRGTPVEASIKRTLEGEVMNTSEELVPGLFLDSWLSPIRDADGKIMSVLGLSIDSTARQQGERELREKLELIERQAATIRALATPIIRVWDEILCLPVIGTVDSQRTAEMMSSLLQSIAREQARYAIVDLTGVDVVDTSTADHLIRLFKAARVLGVEGVLCGIQPAVAQTVVALGMDLGEVRTTRTLQDALKWCLARRAATNEQNSVQRFQPRQAG